MREAEARMTWSRVKLRRGETEEALAMVQAAMALGSDNGRSTAPPTWFSELAEQLAGRGDFAGAYDARRRADAARVAEGTEQAERRAVSLQLRLQTERLRSDAERERERAEMLLQNTRTLELLSAVGQELMAQLQAEHIYPAIQRHVEGLLKAEFFSVYLLDSSQRWLRMAYGVQAGRRLEPTHYPVDHPTSWTARCLREGRELNADLDPHLSPAAWIPGADRTRSALFAPLRVGERVIGVMSIQAVQAAAFGDRELLIFRNLCAFASIALSNAQAYEALGQMQRQLASRQKLAAVGGMVAGMSHELNTPIGNALLGASTLHEQGVALAKAMAQGPLTRGQLTRFVSEVEQGSALLLRNLGRAADLVQDFKELVQDGRSLRRERFALLPLCRAVVVRFRNQIEEAGHSLSLDVPPDLQVDGYPDAFVDVLRHGLQNALAHAWPDGRGGQITLSVQMISPDDIELRLSDDGQGMAPAAAERAFEPFFTTRMGSEHSGLGLSVVHSIAVDLFGGDVRMSSAPGEGTTLRWVFTRISPRPPAADTPQT
jgi:signal transduction histidine kinase